MEIKSLVTVTVQRNLRRIIYLYRVVVDFNVLLGRIYTCRGVVFLQISNAENAVSYRLGGGVVSDGDIIVEYFYIFNVRKHNCIVSSYNVHLVVREDRVSYRCGTVPRAKADDLIGCESDKLVVSLEGVSVNEDVVEYSVIEGEYLIVSALFKTVILYRDVVHQVADTGGEEETAAISLRA